MTVATLSRIPPPSARPTRPWDPWRSGEPDLADLMADPIVHLLMRRDGLAPAVVWPLLAEVGAALGQRPCRLTAA